MYYSARTPWHTSATATHDPDTRPNTAASTEKAMLNNAFLNFLEPNIASHCFSSDISVQKKIPVTVAIQFGYNNFNYSSVTVIGKSLISVSIQLQLTE
jgi:hypothetical protein